MFYSVMDARGALGKVPKTLWIVSSGSHKVEKRLDSEFPWDPETRTTTDVSGFVLVKTDAPRRR